MTAIEQGDLLKIGGYVVCEWVRPVVKLNPSHAFDITKTQDAVVSMFETQ